MSGQENHDASQISTPSASEPKTPHSSDNAPNPKLDPNDVTPPPSPISGNAATTMPPEFNPYVFPSPVPKNTMDSVKDTLGKWGRWLQTPPRRLKISPETFSSTVKSSSLVPSSLTNQ